MNTAMKVERVKHIKENNTIEIVFRDPSNCMFACSPPKPVPDRVWKEVYGVVNGVITKIQTIEGTHTPAYSVDERITFD